MKEFILLAVFAVMFCEFERVHSQLRELKQSECYKPAPELTMMSLVDANGEE